MSNGLVVSDGGLLVRPGTDGIFMDSPAGKGCTCCDGDDGNPPVDCTRCLSVRTCVNCEKTPGSKPTPTAMTVLITGVNNCPDGFYDPTLNKYYKLVGTMNGTFVVNQSASVFQPCSYVKVALPLVVNIYNDAAMTDLYQSSQAEIYSISRNFSSGSSTYFLNFQIDASNSVGGGGLDGNHSLWESSPASGAGPARISYPAGDCCVAISQTRATTSAITSGTGAGPVLTFGGTITWVPCA